MQPTSDFETGHPIVKYLKEAIERRVADVCGQRIQFNSCLMNHYRSGEDAIGFHADDEKVYGRNPIIASVSFGAERDFVLRRKKPAVSTGRSTSLQSDRRTVLLEHGSVLVMMGSIQHHWHHSLPVRKKISQPRINLTFRRILTNEELSLQKG
mmetsp:Transcript_13371/g.29490  ORF Transcript_13371/g.29490 Transcript_13371/m.29490 type:complete len:153 (+) Transcript_13371:605-1063(+)